MRLTPRSLRPVAVLVLVACCAVPWLPAADEARPAPERVVYLVGDVGTSDLLVLTSAVATADPAPVVLLDTPGTRPYLKGFLAAYRPSRVVPVGSFDETPEDRERRLGVTPADALTWKEGPPVALYDALFPKAQRVVVCPLKPRAQLLQAACLAGAIRAPLFVLRDLDGEKEHLARRVADWRPSEVIAVGEAATVCRTLRDAKVTALADEALSAELLRREVARGKVDTLVVANPADAARDLPSLARLAPWLALQRRAALLLTNDDGDNAAAVVRAALKNPDLRRAENLVLVADLKAIPMEKRKNPAEGKDESIEMEPLTPDGEDAFTFSTGRLFSDDPGLVTLSLARQRLMVSGGPRKAVVASNPGGGLPLLEMFSRHTARELKNRGYETTAMFEDDVKPDDLRRAWPDADVFLWEGHYKTMIDEFKVPTWTEPLKPSLVFLQSCLALNPDEVRPLVKRGAVATVGSSTRTYSGTGGAFSLAFFDATLYDDQPLGGSLRQAKNFLLAWSILKQKRLGESAKLTGANVRSAWAFTLWGDPALKLPKPDLPRNSLPAVRADVKDGVVILQRPEEMYEPMKTENHYGRIWPNARLAGLTTKPDKDDDRRLVPLLFTEVKLTPPKSGRVPRLVGRVPGNSYAFVWDGRRESGYLLVVPPSRQAGDLKFEVRWGE